jgi:hypothetical protein
MYPDAEQALYGAFASDLIVYGIYALLPVLISYYVAIKKDLRCLLMALEIPRSPEDVENAPRFVNRVGLRVQYLRALDFIRAKIEVGVVTAVLTVGLIYVMSGRDVLMFLASFLQLLIGCYFFVRNLA